MCTNGIDIMSAQLFAACKIFFASIRVGRSEPSCLHLQKYLLAGYAYGLTVQPHSPHAQARTGLLDILGCLEGARAKEKAADCPSGRYLGERISATVHLFTVTDSQPY